MDSWVVVMMLGVSISLGALGLIAFMWGIKNGQFEDKDRDMTLVHDDGEQELNEAAERERRKKDYRPE